MPVQPVVAPVMSTEVPRVPVARAGHATIGPSIVIRGEVSGNEDLLIQGQVDGSVALDLHSVTVGGGGRVKADITGRVITIEGNVEGDLKAKEQIILRGSSTVHGDLKAPRVVLEDGASFRGLVDMGARDGSDVPDSRRAEKAANGSTRQADARGPASESPKADATTARPGTQKGKEPNGPSVGA